MFPDSRRFVTTPGGPSPAGPGALGGSGCCLPPQRAGHGEGSRLVSPFPPCPRVWGRGTPQSPSFGQLLSGREIRPEEEGPALGITSAAGLGPAPRRPPLTWTTVPVLRDGLSAGRG